MGLIYDAGDSGRVREALAANLTAGTAMLDQLSAATERLVSGLGAGELSGHGYSAVEALFAQVIAPCIARAKAELGVLSGELERYVWEDSKVSRFGVLKEHELTVQLTATRNQRDATVHLMEVNTQVANSSIAVPVLVEAVQARNRQLQMVLTQLETDIRDLEDRLTALQGFALGTRGLFMGRLEALTAATGDVIGLLNQLSEPALVPGVRLNLLDTAASGLGAVATRQEILGFLAGKKITEDAKGRLKVDRKFLYKPGNKFLYGTGGEFNQTTGTRVDHYKRPIKAGASAALKSPVDDFTGWKDASKLAKYGKAAGVAGTALSVGVNADKYFSDGVQDLDVPDFAVDTGVDIAGAAAAAGVGAAVGSFILPPAGTIVGALFGILVSVALNSDFGGTSATDATKDAIKNMYR